MARVKYAPVEPGQRYTLLTVVELIGKAKDNHKLWLCKCDCGNYTTVRDNSLKGGRTHSCGCYVKTSPNKRGYKLKHPRKSTVGYKERLYRIYWGMKTRCSEGHYYYDRGIRMCDEWMNDYQAFKKWAYANGFDENADGRLECSIDRIDNNGDYTPDNCRWATAKVQSRNKRTNVKYLFRGEMLVIRDIAEKVDVSANTIRRRLKKGMTIEEATSFTTREVYRYGKNTNARL